MISKQNMGKFCVVVFLTLLIWIWADLAQDEELPIELTLTVDNDANPNWWMAFSQPSSGALSQSIHLEELVLKGPVATIQRLGNQRPLDFGLTVAPARFGTPGSQTFPLLPYLREQDSISRQGVTVESCSPATIDVEVREMVLEENLPVFCFDGAGNRVSEAVLIPMQISAYVPKSWSKEERFAKVTLRPDQWANARVAPIRQSPRIEVMPGQFRDLTRQPIEISMPPAEDNRQVFPVQGRCAFVAGEDIFNAYRVVLDTHDLPELISTIRILATEEARQAYEKMSYQVYIEVLKTEPLEQQVELKYNFPLDYYRKGEIELNQSPSTASFHLEPLESQEEN